MNAMSIYKIVVVAVLLGMASISSAVEETWTRKTDMPTARLGLSTSVVNGKIYAIGGGYSIDGPHSKIVEEYDPVTDTWARKADMPTGRLGHAASVINGKIYVIGGDVRKEVSGAEVEEYDPATDTWAAKAAMPTKRTFLCSCAVDGKIYAIGGITAPAMHTPSALEVYDPATDTWTRKADIPTARSMVAASVVDGKIYVIGGVIGGVGGAGISIVEEYDPTTDTWMGKANMPTGRKALFVSTVAGKIYATGGGTGYSSPFSALEEYDPATDTWTRKADMPITRYFHSTSAVDDKIFVFGGAVRFPPVTSTSTVEEYELTPPPPDFDGDGIVDVKDLLLLIESWGQNNPLVDIAPPFGDGVIDVLDLEVFMNHWLQEVKDSTLVAHWPLDEVEGDIAHDTAGMNDAFTIGSPVWLPAGGMVDGALELDGIDDYVVAPLVLEPGSGQFSVFAWVQGGAPGQVILSPTNGRKWLSSKTMTGVLMTELIPGLTVKSLSSQTVITDGEWHCVGLSWDDWSNLVLYIDGAEVVRNTQSGIPASLGDLYIGTGKALEPGTYWSGLIDDVRIYNRVLSPEQIQTMAQ